MERGAFEVRPDGEAVRFVAELAIGSDLGVVGRLFDLAFARLFRQRIAAMRQHLAEEGRNLKAILESPAARDR